MVEEILENLGKRGNISICNMSMDGWQIDYSYLIPLDNPLEINGFTSTTKYCHITAKAKTLDLAIKDLQERLKDEAEGEK